MSRFVLVSLHTNPSQKGKGTTTTTTIIIIIIIIYTKYTRVQEHTLSQHKYMLKTKPIITSRSTKVLKQGTVIGKKTHHFI